MALFQNKNTPTSHLNQSKPKKIPVKPGFQISYSKLLYLHRNRDLIPIHGEAVFVDLVHQRFLLCL